MNNKFGISSETSKVERRNGEPAHQKSMGSTVSSPNGVRGRTRATVRFSCILEAPYGLSYNLILLSFKLGGKEGFKPAMLWCAVPKMDWGS